MALGNPIDAWLQMAQNKNQNRLQMYGDIAGIGQGLGQTLGTIGDQLQEQKKKQQWKQTINSLMNNPNLSPQMKAYLPMIAQQPELMGQIGPELLKTQKQPLEWAPISGALSPSGDVLEYDKTNGQVKDTGVKAQSTGFGSTMAPIRKSQYTLQDLPSNQGPTTAGGAAYQVKVGAKQGKALIARPGSPQRTAAAAADLVRSITRVAPTDMALGTANFSDNLVQRWSNLKQTLTADPSQVDNPKIRKEMYDIFDEMDKSATPFIQNQLDDMADAGFPVTDATRKRQLGETLPNIPFQEQVQPPQQGGIPSIGSTFNGKKVVNVQPL